MHQEYPRIRVDMDLNMKEARIFEYILVDKLDQKYRNIKKYT